MSREDRVKPQVCPECGSRLAVGNRSYDGVPVSIVVCTGYPDCPYFYWSVAEADGNPGSQPAPKGLESWAIDESLDVLHDELSPQEWQEALAFPRGQPEEGGDRRA